MTEFQRSLTRFMYAALILAFGLSIWGLARPGAVRGNAAIGTGNGTPGGVTATGTCIVRTEPELVDVTFGVKRTDGTASAAYDYVKSRTEKAVQVLEAAGVAARDIQTEDFQLRPSWDDKRKTMMWVANESLRVRIRKVESAGSIIDKVVASGVTNVSSLEYTVEDLDALRAKGRTKAAEVARRKAAHLADSLGGKLGRLTSVSEGYPGYYDDYYGGQANVVFKSAALSPAPAEYGSAAKELTLKTGEVRVTVVVTATYELE
jgi:uncharacterized protein YggE